MRRPAARPSRRALSRRWTPLTALAALLAFVWFWFTPTSSPDVYGGFPKVQNLGLRLATHVLQNPGFAVGYNEWYRDALWVGFRAHALAEGQVPPRPEHFEVDARTLARVSGDDYRDSGYDRGHLAPNYLMARLYGERAQAATFRMSNVAPQKPRLNQLLWQRIEEAEADIVAPEMGALWVLTGPLFGADSRRLRSGVEIPAAFYRIWLARDADGQLHALAFVVPQQVRGDEPLTQYVATVRQVEDQTGLDFFSELPRPEQERLENIALPDEWQMPRYAQAPPRYAEKFRGR